MIIQYILPKTHTFTNIWCVYQGLQNPLGCIEQPMTTKSILEYVMNKCFQNITAFGVVSIGGIISFIGCSQLYKYMKKEYKQYENENENKNEDSLSLKPYKIINSITRLKIKLFGFGKTRNELEKQQQEERDNQKKINAFKTKTKNEQVIEFIKKWSTENMFNTKTKARESYDTLSVHDSTPDGGIFMKYNKENDTFYYWSDSDIRYTILDTVARKYCTLFNCGELYMSSYEKNTNTNINTNIKTDKNITTTTSDTSNNTDDNKKTNEDDEEEDDDSFLFINENKAFKNIRKVDIQNKLSQSDKNIYFIKKGCINDYNQLIFVKSVNKENPFHKKVSYSEFIKQQQQKNNMK